MSEVQGSQSLEERNMSSAGNLDVLFNKVEMGRWQALGLLANFISWSFYAILTTGSMFWNPPVEFYCCQNVSSIPESESFHERRIGEHTNLLNPTIFDNQCLSTSSSEDNSENTTFSSDGAICTDITFVQDPNEGVMNFSGFAVAATGLKTCPFVAYDNSVFSSTVMTEWHLVCEQAAYFDYFQNFLIAGMIVACLIGGNLGDWFGRVKTLFTASLINVLGTALVVFAPGFAWILFGRFISGFTMYASMIVAFAWCLETCPLKYRGPLGMLSGVVFDGCLALFCLVAYYARDWRSLYMYIGWPTLVMVPISWFMDESPRWLTSKRKLEKAADILWKAAKMNKSSISSKRFIEESLKKEIASENAEEQTGNLKTCSDLKEVVSSWVMMHLLIAASAANFLNKLQLYAAYFSGNRFAGSNVFLFIGLGGVLSSMGNFLGIPITEYFGRKSGSVGTSLIAGLLMFILQLVPEEYRTAQWSLFLSSMLFMVLACQIISLYTPELFPTVIRARGLSLGFLFGILGIMTSPIIPRDTVDYGWWIPGATMALSGILCGFILLSLPETKGYPLCETVADVEKRAEGRRRSSICRNPLVARAKFSRNRVGPQTDLIVQNNHRSYSN